MIFTICFKLILCWLFLKRKIICRRNKLMMTDKSMKSFSNSTSDTGLFTFVNINAGLYRRPQFYIIHRQVVLQNKSQYSFFLSIYLFRGEESEDSRIISICFVKGSEHMRFNKIVSYNLGTYLSILHLKNKTMHANGHFMTIILRVYMNGNKASFIFCLDHCLVSFL